MLMLALSVWLVGIVLIAALAGTLGKAKGAAVYLLGIFWPVVIVAVVLETLLFGLPIMLGGFVRAHALTWWIGRRFVKSTQAGDAARADADDRTGRPALPQEHPPATVAPRPSGEDQPPPLPPAPSPAD